MPIETVFPPQCLLRCRKSTRTGQFIHILRGTTNAPTSSPNHARERYQSVLVDCRKRTNLPGRYCEIQAKSYDGKQQGHLN
jgi:hypothetical protein